MYRLSHESCVQETHRLPGTKMSPKPRSEKGRSQRARGEEFNLGTLSTMGSWNKRNASVMDPAGDANLATRLTFSCVAKSEGPAATSTMMLSPLWRRQVSVNVDKAATEGRDAREPRTFVKKGVMNTKKTS